jgi:hypothetical protein
VANNPGPTVSEGSLQERLDRLRGSFANRDDLIRELERFVRKAPDDQIVRINPIQYAADHGRDEAGSLTCFCMRVKRVCSLWSGTVCAAAAV